MQTEELSKTKASLYARLSSAKMRRKEGLFLVEGEKSVADTAGLWHSVALIATEKWIERNLPVTEKIAEAADRQGCPVYHASSSVMAQISTLATPPEVIAVYRLPEEKPASGRLPEGIYLMLDGVQDPGNMGTIIRTAHWFGVRKIFASRQTVDIFNPKVIQSTMGSIASVDVEYCDLADLARLNPEIPVCCLDLNGENLFEASLPASAFIAMGNEGNGISPSLKEVATRSYTIPASDPQCHPDSLNVAIATAITLAQFKK